MPPSPFPAPPPPLSLPTPPHGVVVVPGATPASSSAISGRWSSAQELPSACASYSSSSISVLSSSTLLAPAQPVRRRRPPAPPDRLHRPPAQPVRRPRSTAPARIGDERGSSPLASAYSSGHWTTPPRRPEHLGSPHTTPGSFIFTLSAPPRKVRRPRRYDKQGNLLIHISIFLSCVQI
jgi:hypothetical protein